MSVLGCLHCSEDNNQYWDYTFSYNFIDKAIFFSYSYSWYLIVRAIMTLKIDISDFNAEKRSFNTWIQLTQYVDTIYWHNMLFKIWSSYLYYPALMQYLLKKTIFTSFKIGNNYAINMVTILILNLDNYHSKMLFYDLLQYLSTSKIYFFLFLLWMTEKYNCL